MAFCLDFLGSFSLTWLDHTIILSCCVRIIFIAFLYFFFVLLLSHSLREKKIINLKCSNSDYWFWCVPGHALFEISHLFRFPSESNFRIVLVPFSVDNGKFRYDHLISTTFRHESRLWLSTHKICEQTTIKYRICDSINHLFALFVRFFLLINMNIVFTIHKLNQNRSGYHLEMWLVLNVSGSISGDFRFRLMASLKWITLHHFTYSFRIHVRQSR